MLASSCSKLIQITHHHRLTGADPIQRDTPRDKSHLNGSSERQCFGGQAQHSRAFRSQRQCGLRNSATDKYGDK